jgi:purine-binding chemotaxis protein CheW
LTTSATNNIASDQQVVVFRLDRESYAIDIFRVNEIIRLREITPVPQTRPHIRGLVNLRGKTIPVVDIRSRFGLPPSPDVDSTRIIVVESEMGNVGIVVDEVSEVLSLTADSIEQTPSLVDTESTEFVRGIAHRQGRLITLLDLDKALNS